MVIIIDSVLQAPTSDRMRENLEVGDEEFLRFVKLDSSSLMESHFC